MANPVAILIAEGFPVATPVISVTPTIPVHIRQMNESMRDEDAQEAIKLGFLPNRLLWRSYKASVISRTGFIDGRIAAIWGCAGTCLGNSGQPWLVTSKEVKKISPLKFTRIYQEEVYNMLNLFPVLENYVDSQYTSAVRLLDMIGFSIGEPEIIGTGEFCKFSMRVG